MSVRLASIAPCALLTLTLLTDPLNAQQLLQLPARDNMLAERPTNVFAIGAEEGESWEMFSGIRALAFDKADNLYILDGQNFRVVVFDARGKFLRQFGKKGGGPGELQAPIGLAILSDGTIAISDLANRGYIIYKPTGEYVRNVTFPEEVGMPLGRIEPDARGGIVTRSNASLFRGPGAGNGPPAAPTGPIYTSFTRQQLAGTTASANAPERPASPELYKVEIPTPRVLESGPNRRAFISMEPAFGARPTFGVLPDGGLAIHHETEYHVKLLDASGRHTRTLARAFTPRKVTKKDQEEEIERRKNARASGQGQAIAITMGGGGGGSNVTVGSPGNVRAGGGGAGPAFQFNPEDVPFAEVMSVVTNLRTDPTGRVWIQRRHTDGSNQGPIDIVTAAGKYIGTIAPQPLPDIVSASGLAAYIVRDDLGVERVSVRRLPANWR